MTPATPGRVKRWLAGYVPRLARCAPTRAVGHDALERDAEIERALSSRFAGRTVRPGHPAFAPAHHPAMDGVASTKPTAGWVAAEAGQHS